MENWVEIDLKRLKNNYEYIKNKSKSPLCAVIKADGYGVGSYEIAKELVKDGHRVTVFCGNDGHAPRNEKIDGVQMVRRGGFYTVYAWAMMYYVFKFRGLFDIVIDSENGIPFFTPLYVRAPKFLLIHHIHQEVFREHLRFPFSHIAMFIEALAIRAVAQCVVENLQGRRVRAFLCDAFERRHACSQPLHNVEIAQRAFGVLEQRAGKPGLDQRQLAQMLLPFAINGGRASS